MSETATAELPSRVERKIRNRNGDEWYEFKGEQMFSDDALARVRQRFAEMRRDDYESIAHVGGGNYTSTKIRTKDLDEFRDRLADAKAEWVDEHGARLTAFGNSMHGEHLTDYECVEIHEESARKTVLWARYDAGRTVNLGGARNKKADILLAIRDYEQWSYHNEVVKPLFAEFHERYPY